MLITINYFYYLIIIYYLAMRTPFSPFLADILTNFFLETGITMDFPYLFNW